MDVAKTYRIGEVAEMLNLKTYVLRFWETEFTQLIPDRTESGQRIYSSTHVNLVRRIRELLHEQGMTIEGAKKILECDNAPAGMTPQSAANASLQAVREELVDICHLLEGKRQQ